MHRGFLIVGSIAAMLSVVLGAFGAHAMKSMVSDHAVATFETGVRYQFYHSFAIIIVAITYQQMSSRLLVWAARMFIIGIILFSFSLYVLALLQAAVSPDYKWIGAITPFGGLSFIAGWILMLITFIRKR